MCYKESTAPGKLASGWCMALNCEPGPSSLSVPHNGQCVQIIAEQRPALLQVTPCLESQLAWQRE